MAKVYHTKHFEPELIEWYRDEEIEIYFSEMPKPVVLYPTPFMDEKKIKEVEKKPFLHKRKIKIVLVDNKKKKRYEFFNPENYRWDGASIPRMFWRLIGAKSDNRFLIPSFVHDLMCEDHERVGNDRYFSTCVFERLLYCADVNAFSRWMMKHSVDNFQKFKW